MNHEDKILALFDNYFETTSQEEIEQDLVEINKLPSEGISFEGYLDQLNANFLRP